MVELCLLVLEQRFRNLFSYHSFVVFLLIVTGFFISYFYTFYFSRAPGGKKAKTGFGPSWKSYTDLRARIQ